MAKQVRYATGVVAFRDSEDFGLEFYLATKTGGKGKTCPKGGLEDGLTPQQNAVKEAFEEVGVVGVIGDRLGAYTFTKAGIKQHVTLFAMEVSMVAPEFPEKGMRSCDWYGYDEIMRDKLVDKAQRKIIKTLYNDLFGWPCTAALELEAA